MHSWRRRDAGNKSAAKDEAKRLKNFRASFGHARGFSARVTGNRPFKSRPAGLAMNTRWVVYVALARGRFSF